MENVLKINSLSKRFGRIQAVDKLDLAVIRGQVFGILGPNGSGKTTTLGMILEVVAPSGGTFQWFNNVKAVEARKNIGSILETPSFYPYLTAVQNLRIAAHIKQCGTDRIETVLELVVQVRQISPAQHMQLPIERAQEFQHSDHKSDDLHGFRATTAIHQ